MNTLGNIDYMMGYNCCLFNGRGGLGYKPYNIIGGALNEEQIKEKITLETDISDLKNSLNELMSNIPPENASSDELETFNEEIELILKNIKEYEGFLSELKEYEEGDDRLLTYEEIVKIPDVDILLSDYVKNKKMPQLVQGRTDIETTELKKDFLSLLEENQKIFKTRFQITNPQLKTYNMLLTDLEDYNRNIDEMKKIIDSNPHVLKMVKEEIEKPENKRIELINKLDGIIKHNKKVFDRDILENMTLDELEESSKKYKMKKAETSLPEEMKQRALEIKETLKLTPQVDFIDVEKELVENDYIRDRLEDIKYSFLKKQDELKPENRYTSDAKNKDDFENQYNEIVNIKGKGSNLLVDNEPISALIYNNNPDLYNNLILNNAKIEKVIKTGEDYIDKNGNKIYEANPNFVYDNLVVIHYDEDGILKEYKMVIENKFFHRDKYAGKEREDYSIEAIDETNKNIDLIRLSNLNNAISEALILDDEDEVERLLEEYKTEKTTKKGILFGFSKSGMTTTALEKAKEKTADEKLKQEYDYLLKNHNSNVVPKFDKQGKLKGFTDKTGTKMLNKTGYNLFKGAEVYIDMRLPDCQITTDYSKLIRDKKINPQNPRETHELSFSSYGSKGLQNLIYDRDDFRIMQKIPKKAPSKIKRNKSTRK